jgi:hypothetical protein
MIAERLRQETFADAGRTEEQNVAAFAQEVAGGQFENQLLGDGGVETPVELIERLDLTELGGLDATAIRRSLRTANSS